MPAVSGRFRILFLGQPLGTGVNESRGVTISAVAKANGPNAPYCVPNEVVCGELGRFLGLPIPPAGVVFSPQSNALFYASLDFNLTGNTLPPVNTTRCVKMLPRESTGLILFDILIANSDRHGRNFSVDFGAKPPVINIFDHSHALLGKDQGKGISRLNRLRDRLGISAGSHTAGNRHCILDQLSTDEHFGEWFDRIRAIPDFFINDLCAEMPNLGCSKEETKAVADFLKHRRAKLEWLVEANKAEFTAIPSWRLFR